MIKSTAHCTQTYLRLTEIYTQLIATRPHDLLQPVFGTIWIEWLSDRGQHNLLKTPHQKLLLFFAAFCRDYFRFLKKISRFSNMPSELERSRFQRSDISSVLCVECVLLIFLLVFLYNPTHTKVCKQPRIKIITLGVF